MSFLPSLRRDRRGAAAVEFALALPILVAVLGGMTDLGLIERARGQLAEAVDAGGQYAVLTGTTATAQSIETAICAAANPISSSCAATGSPAVVVSATAPTCGCVTNTAGTITLTAASCGSTCSGSATAGGATAGSFVQMSASYTYQSILGINSKVVSKTITEKSWVRLQ
jgi:Flp pilus assembly protein TadG